MKRRVFIRSRDADVHLEIFLVAAVASILAIRFALELTDYPKLGGGPLHLAHVLWGGLLMLVALGMLLSFIGRATERLAALVGGVGFGTFIDEIGKFITKDTDYFFRPSVAIIYVVFVLAVLAGQAILRRLHSPEENLINALKEVEELAVWNLDVHERARAAQLLARSDPMNPLVPALQDVLIRAPLSPVGRPGPYLRLRGAMRAGYGALTQHRHFRLAIVWVFAGQFVWKLVYTALVAFVPWTLPTPEGYAAPPRVVERLSDLGPTEWLQLGSTVLSGAFVAIGFAALRRSRILAYRNLKRSLLVSIFVTQVFMFYHRQWDALFGLAVNLLLLAVVQTALDLEASGASTRESTQRSGTSHMSPTST